MPTCSVCGLHPPVPGHDLCTGCRARCRIVPAGVIGAMEAPVSDPTPSRTRPVRTAEEVAELSRVWEETYGSGREG